MGRKTDLSSRSNKSLICISCPIGCHLTVEYDKDNLREENIKISGNKCSRGITYGREEVLAPKRTVTATVSIASEIQRRLPVKTTKHIDKVLIFELLDNLYSLKVKPPVNIGERLIENFKGTGVDVVATMKLDR